MGLCASLGSLKILKILRFNQNISFLGLTLKNCFSELFSYSCVLFIIWFAFVQLMYLMFGSYMEEYLSLTKAMENAFQVTLGKFDVAKYSQNSPTLGPAIFSAYNIVILFFGLNIFISIIVDSFEKVRKDAFENPNKFDLWVHICKRIEQRFYPEKNDNIKMPSYEEYRDHLSTFHRRIDRLISYLIRVTFPA
jgi:hypothetical protein